MRKLIALWAALSTCAAMAQGIALENETMRILFGGGERGFGVTGIVNRVVGDARFLADTREVDFWRMSFADTTAKKPYSTLADVSSRAAAHRHYVTREGNVTHFHFEGMAIGAEKDVLDVTASVALREDGLSYWTIQTVNRSRRYALYETKYPVLKRVLPAGTGDALLPCANLGARLIRGFSCRERAWGAAYLGYSPMVTGWFLGEAGLYVAAHDRAGHIKRVEVDKDGNLTFITVVADAGCAQRAATGPDYPVAIGCLKGDWWQVAKTYRRFAMTCPWTAKGPIVSRKDYPHAFAETDLWFNQHGGSDKALHALTLAKKKCPDVRTGLHWHGWNLPGHDTNYPEYFPTVRGVSNAVAQLKAIDQMPMIYTNGRLWDAGTMGWLYAQASACLHSNGHRYIERYANKRQQGVMCPADAPWQNVMLTLTRRITGSEVGAPSLFMDQIGAAPPSPCFDPRHNHTLGGGTYWFDGYRRMLAHAHQITLANGAALTTEGTCEAWMDCVDAYLVVTMRQPDDVPFYPAVYSGYTTYFGSRQNDNDDAFAWSFVQMREALSGVAVGWCDAEMMTKPTLAEKWAVLQKLATLRKQYRKYLTYGTLEDEARFAVLPLETPITLNPSFATRTPTTGFVRGVFGREWLSADGAQRALFVANALATPQKVTVMNAAFAGEELSLAPGEIRVLERTAR